jgi:Leucine-rich repeat (LRR) protein
VIFGYNRKLQTLVLARNNILESNALAFHEENGFSYLDISRNKIEKLEGLTLYGLRILNILKEQFTKSSFKSFINLQEQQILSLAVKTFSKLMMKRFFFFFT